ncbi:MAG: hypothetical protein ABSA18_10645 [Dehalococcoidia bacterium]|jgi:hypothetical protein
MAVYVICFDFFRPVDQILLNTPVNVTMYEPLFRAIESLGSSKQFSNSISSVFLVKCELSPKEIHKQLSHYITIEDRILITEVKDNYEAHFDISDWLRDHI